MLTLWAQVSDTDMLVVLEFNSCVFIWDFAKGQTCFMFMSVTLIETQLTLDIWSSTMPFGHPPCRSRKQLITNVEFQMGYHFRQKFRYVRLMSIAVPSVGCLSIWDVGTPASIGLNFSSICFAPHCSIWEPWCQKLRPLSDATHLNWDMKKSRISTLTLPR